jgi:hypothetical protein
MASSTVDISDTSRELLRELADKTGQTTSQVIDKALAANRRQVFFEKMNVGYAELRGDPQAWAEFEAEHREFDATSMDGLDMAAGFTSQLVEHMHKAKKAALKDEQ